MTAFPLVPFLALTVALLAAVGALGYYGSRTNLIGPQPDPLARTVHPLPPTSDPQHVPVARDELGRVVHMPLIDTHILVAGATGSGKGSVLWSLACGIQPAVAAGLVRLWGIDAKGGQELTIGAELFDFVVDNPEDAATVLERAVQSMNRRTRKLARAGIRNHAPTREDPLVVIVIDELADLLDGDDPKLNRRIAQSVRSILRKGRAPSVVLIGCTQDARKAVIPDRDLWVTRVALRTNELGQAALILGQDAVDAGALTHRIPRRYPGIGYVIDETGQPRRLRFCHYRDADIRASVDRWTTEDDTAAL